MKNTNKNSGTAVKMVRIYQIKSVSSEYAFREYAYVESKGLAAPPAELYDIVFNGELAADNLEDIYTIFNIGHPPGYKSRSLSKSDIVELYDDKSSSFYYCDYIGLERLRLPRLNTIICC